MCRQLDVNHAIIRTRHRLIECNRNVYAYANYEAAQS